MVLLRVWIVLILVWVSGCTSDNEHFCTRYQYLYEQLSDKDLPPYNELKSVLLQDIQKNDRGAKRAKMMLLALEDYHSHSKPIDEGPRDFCLRMQRWTQ